MSFLADFFSLFHHGAEPPPPPVVSTAPADRLAVCLPFILRFEGGWSDDPADPGGATMEGVTLATYSQFLGRPASKSELRLIPDTDRNAIYRSGYWAPVHGDELGRGLDLIVFDSAVNCGVHRASLWLQHALGVVQDGKVGPATLKALADANCRMVIEDVRQQREAHYRSLPTFARFGRGWLARLSDVSTEAFGMVLDGGER